MRRIAAAAVLVLVPSISGVARAMSFEDACKAPGVLRCVGFDSPADFVEPSWPNPGLYFSTEDASHERASRDTSVKASGSSSLKFTIPSGSGSDPAGQWRQNFAHSFQAGETFYVQFRQRFSPEMIDTPWKATGNQPTAWKQVIFHQESATCAALELTTVRYLWGDALPTMYTECGARGLTANGDDLLQQGDYTCPWQDTDPQHCFYYAPNVWTTFSYEVRIGSWGQPNSSIKAWIALDGQPLKKWIDLPAFTLTRDAPNEGYDYLTLTPYMTNKNPGVAHPTATTWYDDLIISSQPIGAPSPAEPSPAPESPSTPPASSGSTEASVDTSSPRETTGVPQSQGCNVARRAHTNVFALLCVFGLALLGLRSRRH